MAVPFGPGSFSTETATLIAVAAAQAAVVTAAQRALDTATISLTVARQQVQTDAAALAAAVLAMIPADAQASALIVRDLQDPALSLPVGFRADTVTALTALSVAGAALNTATANVAQDVPLIASAVAFRALVNERLQDAIATQHRLLNCVANATHFEVTTGLSAQFGWAAPDIYNSPTVTGTIAVMGLNNVPAEPAPSVPFP